MPKPTMARLDYRTWCVIALASLGIAAAFFLPAIPQPLDYHQFADNRTMFGVANFLDVVSNTGFLLAGVAGLVIVGRKSTEFASARERWPYAVFFAGLLLTAPGSAWYHLMPDNERLFWDRLPMTIAFMALIAAQIVDRIDVKAGLVLLAPMLLLGAASVVYWRATERAGDGNLVPYGMLQICSMLLLLLIAALHPSRYTHANAIYWVFAAYALAKGFEHFDGELLALGNVASGHTLKHLAAALAGIVVCHMLWRRTSMTRAVSLDMPSAAKPYEA